jgi:signal transduction histidine kinase
MFRGLKTLTVLNIMALMLIGMVLTDFVLVSIFQKKLIDSETERARTAIRMLIRHDRIVERSISDRPFLKRNHELIQWLRESGSFCALLIFPDPPDKILIGSGCPFEFELTQAVLKGMESGIGESNFIGKTWGVFWKQPQHLMIFEPVFHGDHRVGGMAALFSLEGIYRSLRNSQKTIGVYVLVNILLLSGVGLYRISKLYFEPLHRLAMRAEAYAEEEMPFSVRKEDNELNQLSKSLNTMVKRISTDKQKLKSTIHSLEKANQDLQSAQQEMIQAEKLASVGRLASGIAHEIGNPLGIVCGYLDLLGKEDILPGERADYLQRAAGEVNRINTIIRQLLDFSRPSRGTPEVSSVHELIQNVITILTPQPFMSSISIELELRAFQDAVMAVPDQLRQVLMNLLINAADAIASAKKPGSGKIMIKTETRIPDPSSSRQQPLLSISVTDNGPGIESKHMDAIFDPFFTTKEPGKGTGLGLWVSFMIIEGMKGKIQVESSPGTGTTLEILLPVYIERISDASPISSYNATGKEGIP